MTLTPVSKGGEVAVRRIAGGGIDIKEKFDVKGQTQKIQRRTKQTLRPVVKSADPYFNHEAAQKAVDLVMKMDEDSARTYMKMVVGDLLEADIEKNQRTLQRHLNAVVSKRVRMAKRALLNTTISKGASTDSLAYAQALAVIEEFSKATPYDYGYRFQESDFRRDPTTGRFRTKIKPNALKTPLGGKQAQGMGIKENKDLKGRDNREARARYQSEYLQISEFLSAVNQSTRDPGNTNVLMHIRDRNTGKTFVRHEKGTHIRENAWDPKNEDVVGVEAMPDNLTIGGAAFSLANSLGASTHQGDKLARRANALEAGAGDFTQSWLEDGDQYNSNARLYGRVAAGSKLLGDLSSPGSTAQAAGRFGEFVGQYGPQAEQVLGPTTRKLAYRYRGTEKKPDAEVVAAYTAALRSENSPKREIGPEEQKKVKQAQERALRNYVAQKATKQGAPGPEGVKLTQDERARVMNEAAAGAYRKLGISRNGTAAQGPQTWHNGRAVLVQHLMDKRPNPRLYGLHLDAGNTPPSEGFIIDSRGQIVAQAVGYGDDHYLPFNLKNLKGLSGGEYVRTRSVGGPTSEDIYTGLVTGAKRIQVVSRSGTFTVEFADDFVGGRRHNDKARRMVRRYENLLDSVQSEKVDRQDVSREIRQSITHDVNEKFSHYSARERRKEVERRVDEFKENPEMSEEDEAAFERAYARNAAGKTEADARKIRDSMYAHWRSEKEYRFKLNGEGYKAALEALQEQFPYYITVTSEPLNDPELLGGGKDRGYVEPGRNRPTDAQAGLHGTGTNKGEKFSASRADYQRGRNQGVKVAGGRITPQEPETGTKEKTTTGDGKPAARPAPDTEAAKIGAQRAASDLVAALQQSSWAQEDYNKFGFLNPANSEKTQQEILTPEGMSKLTAFVSTYTPTLLRDKNIDPKKLDAFNVAVGRVGRQSYDKSLALTVNEKPFYMAEYADDAPESKIRGDLDKLTEKFKPIGGYKDSYAEMSDADLKNELRELSLIGPQLEAVPNDLPLEQREARYAGFNINTRKAADLISGRTTVHEQADAVQRIRTLKMHPVMTAPKAPEVKHKEIEAPDAAETDNVKEVKRRALALREGARALNDAGRDTRQAEEWAEEADQLEYQIRTGRLNDADYDAIIHSTEEAVEEARRAIANRLKGD